MEMDIYKRRVIRRKTPLIAETLGFSIADQKKYMAEGLLTDRMMGNIMIESTEYGQMVRFIDHVMRKDDYYDRLLAWLEDAGKAWVAEEIRAEVTSESGQLNVEDYVYRESGVLVHRRFGKSIAIPEVEKKEFQLMLALRYQCAKEAWRQQLVRCSMEMEDLKRWKSELGGSLKQIVDKIETFLRIQQKHINEHAHDVHTTHEQTRADGDASINTDYLQLVEDKVGDMMETLGRLALEKEKMAEERKRCLEVLQIDKGPLQLDIVLNHALRYAAEDVVKAKRDSELTDKMAQTLDTRMTQLRLDTSKELVAKDRRISQMTSQNHDKMRQIEELEKKLSHAREQVDSAHEEIEKLNRRCAMLERTRRIGFFNPGWYDKIYTREHTEYLHSLSITSPHYLTTAAKNKLANSYADSEYYSKRQRRPLSTRRSYSMIEARIDNGTARSSSGVRVVATKKPGSAR